MSKPTDNIEQDDWISKSERKRQDDGLQKVCRELMDLSVSELKKIPMDELLSDAITLAHKIRHTNEGYRRQMQYVNKVLRNCDSQPIIEALEIFKQRHKRSDLEASQLEVIRDRLLSQGDSAINEVIEQYPVADRQRLRQLVRQANKEAKQEKPAKSAKELFQYLKEAKKLSQD